MCGELLAALNLEWRHLDETAEAELDELAAECPALIGCRTPSDVLDRIRAEPDPVLAALIGLHQGGRRLAGRIVLQTMVGKLVRMAARDPHGELGDYLAAMWFCIHRYPLTRRPRSVAANLALDTRKAVRREREREERQRSLRQPADASDRGEVSARTVLCAAQQLGLIDASTRQLLCVVYADGLSGAEAADTLRLSRATVRFRCSRAVRQLASHAVDLADAA